MYLPFLRFSGFAKSIPAIIKFCSPTKWAILRSDKPARCNKKTLFLSLFPTITPQCKINELAKA